MNKPDFKKNGFLITIPFLFVLLIFMAYQWLKEPVDQDYALKILHSLSLVEIPAGKLALVNEHEEHLHVSIKPFNLMAKELTWEQYQPCIDDGVCSSGGDNNWGKGNLPVINVSWNDIQDYIKWLERKTGQEFRLPSGTEWQYAAKSGSKTNYSWGNDIGVGKANCAGCDNGRDKHRPLPVGSFAPNKWGLHDMHGNVQEWVHDCYDHKVNNLPRDGRAQEYCESFSIDRSMIKSVRGGGFNDSPAELLSAYHHGFNKTYRFQYLGFRLVGVLDRSTKIALNDYRSLVNSDLLVGSSSRKSPITVTPVPSDARVQIMNIGPKYYDGMELEPGRYDIKVSKKGYKSYRAWHNLSGELLEIPIKLQRANSDNSIKTTNRLENSKSQNSNSKDGYVTYAVVREGEEQFHSFEFDQDTPVLQLEVRQEGEKVRWRITNLYHSDLHCFSFRSIIYYAGLGYRDKMTDKLECLRNTPALGVNESFTFTDQLQPVFQKSGLSSIYFYKFTFKISGIDESITPSIRKQHHKFGRYIHDSYY